MVDIRVPKEQIKDHLNWLKQLITICSAALGALLYKFDDSHPAPVAVRIGAVLFVLSMLSCFVAFSGLAGHQSSDDEVLSKRAAFPLFFGWAMFILAFVAVLTRFLP